MLFGVAPTFNDVPPFNSVFPSSPCVMASKSAKTSVLLRSAVFTGDALMLTEKVHNVENALIFHWLLKRLLFTFYDKSHI